MYRTEKLVVRLSQAEHEAIARLAEAKRLPVSTLARVILLQEADAHAKGKGEESSVDRQGLFDYLVALGYGADGDVTKGYSVYEAKARNVLEANWPAVEAVATALLEKRRLSARAVRATVKVARG